LGFLQPERFHDEPIYCEAPYSPDDVVYSGSEDEAYDSPADRRNRYEEQALRFIEGKPPFLLSVSLRGPFDRKSGWANPWRSQSGIKKSAKRKRPSRAKTSKVSVSIRNESFESPKSNVAQVEDEPTQDTNEDSILRVQDWRNRVLAELDVNITGPVSAQVSKPAARQPRMCGEPTDRAPSETGHSLEEADQSSEHNATPSATPIAATPCPLLHMNKPELPPMLLPLDTMDLSPRAMKLYEQSFMPSLSQQSQSHIQKEQPESPLQRRSGTANLLVATPVAAVPVPDQDASRNSLHTDGSFRYRRPSRATRKSSRISELAASKKDRKGDQSHVRHLSPNPAMVDKVSRNAEAKEVDEKGKAVCEEIVVQEETVTQEEVVVHEEEAVEDQVAVQTEVVIQDEVPVQDEVPEYDPSQTPSQIDGITLVAPDSLSSERPSIGCFSAEKASQDEISALLGFPKRLLWPTKSGPSGLESNQSPTGSKPPPRAALSPTPFTLRIRSSGEPPASSPAQEVLQDVASRASTGLRVLQTVLEQPQRELEVPNMALKSERPSPTPPPVLAPKQIQSPWIEDALPLPPRVASLISHDEARPSCSPQGQSPWARGDSQITLPEVRRFDPLSSPANSVILPQATATPPPPQELYETSSQIILTHPSTPESKKSGLPTPEFTLSAKSFRELSTPSPLPAAKRRRISTGEEGESRFQSMEHLIEAAISNPWTSIPKPSTQPQKSVGSSQRPKKPRKSVRFAPLPGDTISNMDPDAATASCSPYDAELSNVTPNNNQHPVVKPRNDSPPPPILMTEPLPSANEKFGKYFAQVTAKRKVGIRTTPSSSLTAATPRLLRSQRKTPRLLPSESQQTCPSPAVDAMAQAFISADSLLIHHQQPSSSSSSNQVTEDGTVQLDIEAMVSGGADESIISLHQDQAQTQEEQQQSPFRGSDSFVLQLQRQQEVEIDDVSAVLENLDDFLGQSWDLDADIAKARAEDKRRESGGG
ncbi:hypothetical protein QBC44DRAFT_221792, partial [Cladorrhinum sp. PSN332]